MAWHRGVILFLMGFLTVNLVMWSPCPASAASAVSEGKNLRQLVEDARKEGQLDLMIPASMGEKGFQEITNSFKKRFGLDIKMTADLSGQESQAFNTALAETKSGIPPTFDLMQGNSPNILNLKEASGAESIQNWELLLAEIDPEAFKVKDKVSPSVLAGYGFVWATRVYGLAYNPKLIPLQDLPRTRKEMANPKYRGMFSVPPFISAAQMGILKYDKNEWLEIMKSLGRSKAHVLHYNAGIPRMMLGDVKFLENLSYNYFKQKALDRNAPIGFIFLEDFTPLIEVMYVVRKGARHPNAAKLFALWVATKEANSIFEKFDYHENLVYGSGPISQQTVEMLKRSKIKPASWFDSPENLTKFRWLEGDEGRKFSGALARAQREGR
jgi:ABC-type Fe3+ transport system substrate-binding protein